MSFFKGGRGSKTVTLVDSEEDDIPLRTARASASVKAKRGGELFVKVFHIEKVGKEMELKKERMKFPMSIEGKDVREQAIAKLRIRKPEKLVPYFISGGVYMDLSRPLEQYVMGITETIELRKEKNPRDKILVILYELGKIESVDVWSQTTVLGVLMSIHAKNENTVNDCVLCTAEPVNELPLDYVLPKSCAKLVFLKRSRVTDVVPERPIFPSRAYLEEMASRTMVNTMWIPPPDIRPPRRAEPSPEERAPTSNGGSGWTKAVAPQNSEGEEDGPVPTPVAPEKEAKIDLSTFDLSKGETNKRNSDYSPVPPSASLSFFSFQDEIETKSQPNDSSRQATRESSSPPSTPSSNPSRTMSLSSSSADETPSSSLPSSGKPEQGKSMSPRAKEVDVVADILSNPEKKYERLIYYLDQNPVPQPRQCAALFKDWFSSDPVFKAYFSGLGVQRVAEILNVLSKALQT